MGWDERLFDLLDDLEGQAEALYAAERDAELADRSRAEYAAVTLASRLMASVGRDGRLLDVDGRRRRSAGELRRVGTGWCLVSGDAGDWLVRSGAIVAVEGVSDRAVPEVAWSAGRPARAWGRRCAGSPTRARRAGGHAGGRSARGRADPRRAATSSRPRPSASGRGGCCWRWRRSAPCRAASPADSGEDGDDREHDVGQRPRRGNRARAAVNGSTSSCRSRAQTSTPARTSAIANPRGGIRTTSTAAEDEPGDAPGDVHDAHVTGRARG